MTKNIQIYICSHSLEDIKKIKSNEIYTPLFVGRMGEENYGYLSDDTGDNISYKNHNLSELTGLYWMCKNSPYEIIGLDHYRRYFAKSQFGRILNEKDINDYLNDYDLIVPIRYNLIEGSLENFINDQLVIELLNIAEKYIKNNCPEYSYSFQKIMKTDKIAFFNMFIGSKKLINKYCDWIFPILDYLLLNVDVSSDERICGVISEFLFNVWFEKNNLKVKECPIKYKGFKLRLFKCLSSLKIVRWIYKYFYYNLKK